MYFEKIVKEPDYIVEANRPNTALILKEIQNNGEVFKTVLRLATSKDNPKYKNSIITFMKRNGGVYLEIKRFFTKKNRNAIINIQ